MLIKNLFTYWTELAVSPGSLLKKKYAAFKSLLEQDKRAHELMAELEEIHSNQVGVDFSVIEKTYLALTQCVRQIVTDLNQMHPSRYRALQEFYRKIDGYARHMMAPSQLRAKPPFCLKLDQASATDTALIGGKAHNLAILSSFLKLPTPAGFVITTNAFYRFIEYNRLKQPIDEILSTIDIQNPDVLNRQSKELVKLVEQAEIPPDVRQKMFKTFDTVFQSEGSAASVAVRSSAVGE